LTLGKIRERDTLLIVIWRKAEWVWRIYAESQSSALGIAPLEEFDGLKEIRARAGRALRSLSPTTRGKAAAQKSE
jgi:hypothetical protein